MKVRDVFFGPPICLISKSIDILKSIPVVTYISSVRRPAPLRTRYTNHHNPKKNTGIRNVPLPSAPLPFQPLPTPAHREHPNVHHLWLANQTHNGPDQIQVVDYLYSILNQRPCHVGHNPGQLSLLFSAGRKMTTGQSVHLRSGAPSVRLSVPRIAATLAGGFANYKIKSGTFHLHARCHIRLVRRKGMRPLRSHIWAEDAAVRFGCHTPYIRGLCVVPSGYSLLILKTAVYP